MILTICMMKVYQSLVATANEETFLETTSLVENVEHVGLTVEHSQDTIRPVITSNQLGCTIQRIWKKIQVLQSITCFQSNWSEPHHMS